MSQCITLFISFCACANAARHVKGGEQEGLTTIPMHTFAQDCGKQRPLSFLHQSGNIPGAGLGKVGLPGGPFKTVLKDGFFQVACAKDKLFYHGDKFGDNKHDYTLGDVTNVSIVHYDAVVAKENRVEMTHEACFEFCRTVPDMLYFGLIHGRSCYCAPYFEMMADDSSDCDEVCAAQPTQMCGGKSKSLVFEMHECNDVKMKLSEASQKGADVLTSFSAIITDVEGLASSMQTDGQKLEDAFGQAGDPAASNLFQMAKEFAGELEHAAEDQAVLRDELQGGVDRSAKLGFANMQDHETNQAAQALTVKMEKETTSAEDGIEALDALSTLASPVNKDLEGSPSNQYYSLMYFVDKKFQSVPSTCSGDVDQKPMIDISIEECASACDKQVLTCVGYSYYPENSVAVGTKSFCFFFSRFTDATYYTGCSSSFLQQPADLSKRTHPTCYAKLSDFENTVIAPDSSGKCKGCLKSATKADRCYK